MTFIASRVRIQWIKFFGRELYHTYCKNSQLDKLFSSERVWWKMLKAPLHEPLDEYPRSYTCLYIGSLDQLFICFLIKCKNWPTVASARALLLDCKTRTWMPPKLQQTLWRLNTWRSDPKFVSVHSVLFNSSPFLNCGLPIFPLYMPPIVFCIDFDVFSR